VPAQPQPEGNEDVLVAVSTEELRTAPEIREGDYGTRVVAVEPGGAEFIPLAERHGRPLQLFWTWTSPNFEFATVFVGVIAVSFFGLNFLQAIAGIVVGTLLGSLTHGVLSARGPAFGVPQMILSRISFGYWGNLLPAGLNSLTAGVGWFAVNSVSGAFALSALTSLPRAACLVIVVAAQLLIAFFGHNLIQTFERYAFPLLIVAFVLAAIWIFSKAHPSAVHGTGGLGGFLLTVGASFGYAAGWNPYASDYTRYLRPDSSRAATGLWAGAGVAVSCIFLEIVGAASATIPGGSDSENPTLAFAGHLPTAVKDITLLAITLGAVSANVINIYSGSLSFTALGVRLPLRARRAVVAVLFGIVGFIVALTGLHDAGSKYENFLLVISYWIGPWLGVYFTNQLLSRRERVGALLFDAGHRSWDGVVAMAVGMAVSISLFSNQTEYVAPVPKHHPAVGDLTFEVGFVLAAALYAVLFLARRARSRASSWSG
jgi:NCS1 family nucleobase:cation symporter-1